MITQKQDLFAREYLLDLNAKQAAIRAGYSKATATEHGSRLLRNVKVKAKIDQLIKERIKRLELKADQVVEELRRIGFSNVKDLVDSNGKLISVNELPREVSAAIADIKGFAAPQVLRPVHIKFYNKIAALDALMKHLGGYKKDNDTKAPKVAVYLPANGRS